MDRFAVAVASTAVVALAAVPSCAASSRPDPDADAADGGADAPLTCDGTLLDACCGGESGTVCLPDVATATDCRSWGSVSGAIVRYAACGGYVAVRRQNLESATAWLYDASSGQLAAVLNFRLAPQPACDGPPSLYVLTACVDRWRDERAGDRCPAHEPQLGASARTVCPADGGDDASARAETD